MLSNIVRQYITNIGNKQKILKTVINAANYATDASFETQAIRLHKLDAGPSAKVSVTKDDALKLYKLMAIVRRIETTAGNLYKEKIIRGFCHLYSGQEAVAVGIHSVMRPYDAAITSYRAHGWVHLMGVSAFNILAELAGRQSGCARGKGGSMHMYTDHFYGGNGIVGAQVPLGVGVAFAQKYNGTDGVCFTLYGDGAANQGQVFEVFNIAKLWSLPCVFVCENNRYGMGTSQERAAANTSMYTRGDSIPGIWIDGMDVLAVRECTKFVINHCASGKGPIVMEADTYRYNGHSVSDPGTSYRSREEIQEVRKTRDPITSFKDKIVKASLVTTDEIKKIDDEVHVYLDDAIKKAKADKEIGMDELSADIYSNCLETSIRSTLPWNPLKHKRIGPAVNSK